MVNRVKYLINEKARSVREFAEKIGVKQVTLNQQISGDRKLSLDIVFSILNSFPDISAEWLLRGKGNMYNTENSMPDIKTGDMQKIYETVVKDKDEQIEKMKAEINQLIGENSIMREQLGIASRKVSNKSA
jgi:plasmid maintenance system antidote protein VapI